MEAAKGLIPILVDCNWGKQFQDLSKTYDGGAYPTVVLTDSDGNEVDRFVGVKSGRELKTRIDSTVEKHTITPEFVESYEEGLQQAKKKGKLALVFFSDGKKDSLITRKALASRLLTKTLDEFVLIRHKVDRRCKTCKAFKTYRGSNLRVLDPNAEDMAKKPVAKMSGRQDVKRLKVTLGNVLKKRKK